MLNPDDPDALLPCLRRKPRLATITDPSRSSTGPLRSTIAIRACGASRRSSTPGCLNLSKLDKAVDARRRFGPWRGLPMRSS